MFIKTEYELGDDCTTNQITTGYNCTVLSFDKTFIQRFWLHSPDYSTVMSAVSMPSSPPRSLSLISICEHFYKKTPDISILFLLTFTVFKTKVNSTPPVFLTLQDGYTPVFGDISNLVFVYF